MAKSTSATIGPNCEHMWNAVDFTWDDAEKVRPAVLHFNSKKLNPANGSYFQSVRQEV